MPEHAPKHSGRTLMLSGLAEVWSNLRRSAGGPGDHVGLIYMVASAAAFSLMAALAKYLLPHTPTQAVVLSRGLLMTTVFVVMARRTNVPLVGQRPARLLLRGLLGYGALSCYFHSVQHLPIGDAILLQYSHPALVAVAAPLLLREATGRGHWIWVAVATLGVALVVGPSGKLRADAVVGLLGAVLSGAAYMTVRELSKTEHPLTILVWFPAVTIPGALIGSIWAGQAALPRDLHDVVSHLCVTACGLIGQVTLTHGLARAGAARATAVTMTGPIFGWILGLVLFGTVPTPASAAGTVLVLGALALLAFNKPRS